MIMVEIPLRKLEDELEMLATLTDPNDFNMFIAGAQAALFWLTTNAKKPSDKVLLMQAANGTVQ